MKEIKSRSLLIYDPETGKKTEVDIFKGESAYEAAKRLGLTTLNEEQWVHEYDVKRDAAVNAIEQKGEETLESIPEDYKELQAGVDGLYDAVGSLYENDFLYKAALFTYKATSEGTYKSTTVDIEGWKPGETYTCNIASVKNNASNKVASLETYDASGARLQQIFLEVSMGLTNTITLDADAAAFKILYRASFAESIAAGTVVTYSGVEIFSGNVKKMRGYDGYVDLAANTGIWTEKATIASNSGNAAVNVDRVAMLEYIEFKHGFNCVLAKPTILTVAKYDKNYTYIGYDSINTNRAYSAEECAGLYFRFTYIISGATATLETLNDDVQILYMTDAQSVENEINALKKAVENVGNEDLPDYFAAEAGTTAADTLAVTDAPCITFALVTDTHQNATDKTVKNIRAVDGKVNFDHIIHLGDVMNTMGDAQYFYDECYNEIEAYRKSVQTGKLYATPGNHDGYALNGKNDTSTDPELYRTLFRVADERTQTVREGDKPYYYVDFAKNKVRFIFLSSKSYNMVNGAYTYIYGFKDEQVEWLLDVLESTEDGWSVMVCSHIPPIDTALNTPTYNVGITGNNGQNIVNILQAWKNRAAVTFKGRSCDFSSLKANKFIVWLCGHVHGDMIKVYQDLTFVTVTAVAAFVPSWEMPEGGAFVAERTENTLTWDSWNSCVLRPDESKLYLFRFGAGDDMVVSY